MPLRRMLLWKVESMEFDEQKGLFWKIEKETNIENDKIYAKLTSEK